MQKFPRGQAVQLSVTWRNPDTGDPVDPDHTWFEFYGPRATSLATYHYDEDVELTKVEPGTYQITLPGTPRGAYSGRFYSTGTYLGGELLFWQVEDHSPQ